MRTELDRYCEMDYAKEQGLAEGEAKGIAKGIAKGKAEGKAEGQAEAKAAIARAMLADGMSPELVAKYTGYTGK